VEEAWQVLGDPHKRHAYDLSHGLAASDAPPPPFAASSSMLFAMASPTPPPPAAEPAPPPPPPPPAATAREEAAPSLPPAMSPWPGSVRMEPVPPLLPLRDASAAAPAAPLVLAEPVTGPALRRFREQVGVSLREISIRSKVGVRYLEYIEQDRHRDLPAPVYLRGFLQEYARAVGLDPKLTADAYLAKVARID
jgi:hypothetical protein